MSDTEEETTEEETTEEDTSSTEEDTISTEEDTRDPQSVSPPPRSRLPLQGYRKLVVAVAGLVALVVLCTVPSAAAHLDKALEGLSWIVASYMGGSAISKLGRG